MSLVGIQIILTCLKGPLCRTVRVSRRKFSSCFQTALNDAQNSATTATGAAIAARNCQEVMFFVETSTRIFCVYAGKALHILQLSQVQSKRINRGTVRRSVNLIPQPPLNLSEPKGPVASPPSPSTVSWTSWMRLPTSCCAGLSARGPLHRECSRGDTHCCG